MGLAGHIFSSIRDCRMGCLWWWSQAGCDEIPRQWRWCCWCVVSGYDSTPLVRVPAGSTGRSGVV